MNKQRKVLITITYNEMGIIIDTKTEELGSSAQLGTNLAEVGTDVPDINVGELINRQAALVAVKDALMAWSYMPKWRDEKILEAIAELPPAEPKREINMAYMRGKTDGINYCTEQLRKMRMEVEHE